MLAVTGYNSRIVQELIPLLPEWDKPPHISSVVYGEKFFRACAAGERNFSECDRYVLCAGVIRPKTLSKQTAGEIVETMTVNCIRPMQLCDAILESNDTARICVIGSESGFVWSYDGAYAAAKAALHRYVETKKLRPHQQLVAIAPSIIEDCGMTMAREDAENLERRKAEHPKRRFLRASEVARLIHFLLYQDEGYLSGTVIRMNGGV
jgi:NAD(P)-dependent dehydrogenase (short-subunit alcohol dehydrogenase family)